MNILLVGSGGREHAIAWKIASSTRLDHLYVAPGNPGTANIGENLPVNAEDIPALVKAAISRDVKLAIIGPEGPLALGLTDALQSAGIRVFGPTRAAAQIESSKAFAKDFMARHQIPTARFSVFTDFESAVTYVKSVDYPIVIKASGLASGKGVYLPETSEEAVSCLHNLLVDHSLGQSGNTVVIEERLLGEEVSVLAFSDGFSVRAMPPAQDHKRLFDNDQGPNTGGMGAYAPAPICPPNLLELVTETIIQPTIDGLRSEGIPFTGVLYTGLILTSEGPKVLEYNCRFGDPETQVILPLLVNDLVDIVDACTRNVLDQLDIRWKDAHCACVVAAAKDYPINSSSGLTITGLDKNLKNNTVVFQAGTGLKNNEIVTAGGRIFGVTAWGASLQNALDTAYHFIDQIHFDGMHYRRDIGAHALKERQGEDTPSAYAQAGVDIDAGNRAVSLMSDAVRSTYTPAVLAGIGSFGGLFDAACLQSMNRPVLVASTDGVGTKVKFAAQANRYFSIGQDIVNHCINDILVQGARPLFFLDYFATSRLKPEMTAEIVNGIAEACKASGCTLLGGETAEMPGVYSVNEFDVAGTIVGVVEYDRILPRKDILPGDLLVGLPSSGPHTNGFSLIRRILSDTSLETVFPELGTSLANLLLAPHRSYLSWLQPALDLSPSPIKGLAHITGGGFIENIPRILPAGLGAAIRWGSWAIPPLYRVLQSKGKISWLEMARVFNLGIGMVVVVAPPDLDRLMKSLPERAEVIGEIVSGEKKVTFL